MPFGALGLFGAAIAEEIIAPIPSPFIMMAGGFLFLKGSLSWNLVSTLFFKVSLPIAFGVTLGSLVIFYIAYMSGKPVLLRYGKWFGLSWNDLERAEKHFEKGYRDELTVFIMRAVPIIPSVAIAALCGLVRMNLRTYIIYTFLGTLVRSSVLAVLGWQFGSLYMQYADKISHVENTILIVLAVCFVLTLFGRFLWARKKMRVIQSEVEN